MNYKIKVNNMKKAMEDGIKFYKSNNGVILTNGINNTLENKYFKKTHNFDLIYLT